MATLSLKISVPENKVIKTIQFDPGTVVYDACRVIRDKVPESALGDGESSFMVLFYCLGVAHREWLETYLCIVRIFQGKDSSISVVKWAEEG